MTHFNQSAPYSGDKQGKIINYNRLTARSIKIFADGERTYVLPELPYEN